MEDGEIEIRFKKFQQISRMQLHLFKRINILDMNKIGLKIFDKKIDPLK
jgi:hypothetical protein